MPVTLNSQQAIRVLKGDIDESATTDSFSKPTNIEISRIYFGNDLKFDKYSNYFSLTNNGTSSVTLYILKYGTSWTSNVSIQYFLSTNYTPQYKNYTAGTAYTSGNTTTQIIIPAGATLYLKNNNDQDHLSQDESNYIKISFSSPLYGGGSWMSLAPHQSDFIAEYSFYKLFEGSAIVEAPDLGRSDYHIQLKGSVFERTFYGCTYLTSQPSFYIDLGGTKTFKETFYGCSSLSEGQTFCVSYYGIPYGTFHNTFYNCTGLITGPNIYTTSSYTDSLDIYEDAFNGTFRGCTNMESLKGLKVASIDQYGMAYSFYGCSSFTGEGLSCLYNTYVDTLTSETYYTHEISLSGNGPLSNAFYNCSSLIKVFGVSNPTDQAITHPRRLIIWVTNSGDGTANSGTMENAFYGCSSLGAYGLNYVSLAGTLGPRALYRAFYQSGITTTKYLFNDNGYNYSVEIGENSEYCLSEAFYGCTSLTKAYLPSGDYAPTYAYYRAFYGCTSITTAIGNIGENISTYCCYEMFRGCTSLTISPYLKASTLATNCYSYMFYSCSSLQTIITNQTTLSTSYTANWIYRTPNGTGSHRFIAINPSANFSSSNWASSGNTSNAYKIPYNWTIINGALLLIPDDSGGNLSFNLSGTDSRTGVSFTRLLLANGGTVTGTGVSIFAGPIVMWGSTPSGILSVSSSCYYYFSATVSFSVFGNLKNLCKQTGTNSKNQSNYSFYRLFYNCTQLTHADGLTPLGTDWTTVTNKYTFSETFRGCTNLVSIPKLAVKQNNEYFFYKTFLGCTSLSDITPDASETTTLGEGTFAMTFEGCTNLKNLMTLPDSTHSLAEKCFYRLYYGCTNLEYPEDGYLPWTTLATECYGYMFAYSGITQTGYNLLPATSLTTLCYGNMFEGCESLEVGPNLPATNTGAGCPYSGMFKGCTNLSELHISFTSWINAWGGTTQRDTYNWTNGLPTSGNFYCPTSLTEYRNNATNTGNSVSGSGNTDTTACYIPYGWTIHREGTVTWPSDMFTITRYSGTTVISPGNNGSLEYTTNGGVSWNDFTSNITISSSLTKIGLRAKSSNNVLGSTDTKFFTTSGSGKVNLAGNISYLYKKSGYSTTIHGDYLFYAMQNIRDCSGLYFNADLITGKWMFMNSTVTAVSRTLLSNHHSSTSETDKFFNMFRGCTSLVSGCHPYTLSDPQDRDFAYIFCGCTSLTSTDANPLCIGQKSSNGTPITYISGDNAYCLAFSDCSSIQSIKLNFQYLGRDSLGNYYESTFWYCFSGCSSLLKIYTLQDRWPAKQCTKGWVSGVPSSTSGTFVKYDSNLSEYHGTSKIPDNWSVSNSTSW